jgi:hypothetical protein
MVLRSKEDEEWSLGLRPRLPRLLNVAYVASISPRSLLRYSNIEGSEMHATTMTTMYASHSDGS